MKYKCQDFRKAKISTTRVFRFQVYRLLWEYFRTNLFSNTLMRGFFGISYRQFFLQIFFSVNFNFVCTYNIFMLYVMRYVNENSNARIEIIK